MITKLSLIAVLFLLTECVVSVQVTENYEIDTHMADIRIDLPTEVHAAKCQCKEIPQVNKCMCHMFANKIIKLNNPRPLRACTALTELDLKKMKRASDLCCCYFKNGKFNALAALRGVNKFLKKFEEDKSVNPILAFLTAKSPYRKFFE